MIEKVQKERQERLNKKENALNHDLAVPVFIENVNSTESRRESEGENGRELERLPQQSGVFRNILRICCCFKNPGVMPEAAFTIEK